MLTPQEFNKKVSFHAITKNAEKIFKLLSDALENGEKSITLNLQQCMDYSVFASTVETLQNELTVMVKKYQWKEAKIIDTSTGYIVTLVG